MKKAIIIVNDPMLSSSELEAIWSKFLEMPCLVFVSNTKEPVWIKIIEV